MSVITRRADSPTAKDSRERILEQAAMDAAHTWTNALRLELAREGRRVEGGWPGTLPEARARVTAEASRVLLERSLPGFTHDELARAARLTYDEARRSWRSHSEGGPRV